MFSNVKRLIFSVWLLSSIGRGNGISKFKSNSSPLVSLSPIIFRLFICNRLFLDTVISSFVVGVNRAPTILKKIIIIIMLIKKDKIPFTAFTNTSIRKFILNYFYL